MSGERIISEVSELERVYDEARLKTLAEVACLAYHLTKLPFAQAKDEAEGKAALKTLLISSEIHCSREDLEKITDSRAELYQQSLAHRLLTKASRQEAEQGPEWIWDKVVNEEAKELAEETKGFVDLLEKIKPLTELVETGSREEVIWLKEILQAARALGIKNDLNLFRFMIEKQKRRIALGKTTDEWETLRPLLFSL